MAFQAPVLSKAGEYGCSYIDHKSPIRAEGPVIIQRFVDRDRTKSVWVGFDHRAKTWVIRSDEEVANATRKAAKP